jgi:SpoVK/Ycf46/Vps4 family AAA+-type ATPase
LKEKRAAQDKKAARRMQLTVAAMGTELATSQSSPAADVDTRSSGDAKDPSPSPDSEDEEDADSADDSDDGLSGHKTAGGKDLALPSYLVDPDQRKKKGKRPRKSKSSPSKTPRGDEDKKEDGEKDGKKDEKEYSKHDQELRARIAGDVMEGGASVNFSDVVGLLMVRLALFEHVILPQQRPDLFGHLPKSFGLLLFGPPGNGKTMIAKCVASEIKCTFFSISASSITSKFVGEAERIMKTLFDMARQRQPSIIFIDEIDSLLTARGGKSEAESSRRIKTEFLVQFDGVISTKEAQASIVVIGATNLPHQLDEAVLRRFPKRILVPNPEEEARYALIRLLCKKQKNDISEEDFQSLAVRTTGYSCSDLSQLCQDAFMGPFREAMATMDVMSAKKSDIPALSMRHFETSLGNVRASTSVKSLEFYDKWDADFGSKLMLSVDVLPESMKPMKIISIEEERKERELAELRKELMGDEDGGGAAAAAEDDARPDDHID